jgi:UDP-N-acetylglucosamine transferase subunit ALG13
MSSDSLSQAALQADVVVSHSGTGSALAALAAGKRPILAPRIAELGEHVDNHQVQISRDLVARSLAFEVDPDSLESAHLVEAARWRVDAAPAGGQRLSLAGLT